MPGQPLHGTGPAVWDPPFFQEPFGVYDWLREHAPVHPVLWPGPPGRAWLVTRYADVHAGQADPRLRHDLRGLLAALGIPEPPPFGGDVGRLVGFNLTLLDPPHHTRFRKAFQRFFTKHRVEAMRPRLEQLADGLLDGLPRDEPVDLLAGFAWKMPLTVVCELLGVPADEHDLFGYGTDASRNQGATGEYAIGAARAIERLRELIARKRVEPGDDALTEFIRAQDAGEFHTEDEIISHAMLLVVAGHETTADLIGNGVLALLTNPDQAALLRSDPGLTANAVEEILRFYPPTDIVTPQYTAEPIVFGDVRVPRHEVVILSRAAANRDPARYPDPDRLDFTRNTTGHLAFGHGLHYCVGAMLARTEAQIVFRRLLDRFPDLRLAVDPAELMWKSNPVARGLVNLPVVLGDPVGPGEGR